MHYRIERNYGCRISDSWTYRGHKTAIIENEILRVVVLIDKGADILVAGTAVFSDYSKISYNMKRLLEAAQR